jgi:prevent-host-death family protein
MPKMAQVSVHEAKTHLSKLLRRVAEGEEIWIANAGRPVAKLVSVEGARLPRKLGRDAGRVRIAPDFDAPLPEAIRRGFEG